MTPTVIYRAQDRCKMNLFNQKSGLYCVQVRGISNNIWIQITPFFLHLLNLIMCESVGKNNC